jgi:hypothetical protein
MRIELQKPIQSLSETMNRLGLNNLTEDKVTKAKLNQAGTELKSEVEKLTEKIAHKYGGKPAATSFNVYDTEIGITTAIVWE